jgi:hypothetical protein
MLSIEGGMSGQCSADQDATWLRRRPPERATASPADTPEVSDRSNVAISLRRDVARPNSLPVRCLRIAARAQIGETDAASTTSRLRSDLPSRSVSRSGFVTAERNGYFVAASHRFHRPGTRTESRHSEHRSLTPTASCRFPSARRFVQPSAVECGRVELN